MKRIVLLSDGTGNSAAKRHKTNVWRLYKALDLHRDDQIAMYDGGVGSQEFLLPRLLGRVFGWGFKANVIQLYKFLCRNYDRDACDKIYLFGFSRGAFTVRVLAGLIDSFGLYTDFKSERDLHKTARANFAAYRKKNYRRRYFAKLLVWEDDRPCQETDSKEPPGDHGVPIEFIGVWDTVDAYGLPVDELRNLWDRFIFPMRFKSRKLGKHVRKAVHAVSIDDERHTFHPVLWDESKENGSGRIEQVWFPGVHSDVGGGYPSHELALVSLDWMMSKVEQEPEGQPDSRRENHAEAHSGSEPKSASETGLIFRCDLRKEYWKRSDWHGIQHDSRSGIRAFYRYRPRNIEALCKKARADWPPRIHRSAFERIKAQVVPYAPTGLPAEYDIVSTRGASPEFEKKTEAKTRHSAMNRALDFVLWRQFLYVALLVTTVMAAATPVAVDWESDAPCAGAACVLGPVCEFAKALLPGHADIWISALCQNPYWLLFLIIAFSLLNWAKFKASAQTFQRAAAAWSHVKRSKTPTEWEPTLVSRLRTHLDGKFGDCLRITWWYLVFVATLAAVILAADRTAFHVRDCIDCMCGPSDGQPLATGKRTVEFNTLDPCMPAGIGLAAGTTYRFEVDNVSGWMDGNHSAGPDGLGEPAPLFMKASVPFRRHLSRPWFELTGRLGQSAGEAFAIGSGTCHTARSSGPLYLYVNDGVSGLMPGRWWAFPYSWWPGSNKGTASITVTAMGPSHLCGGQDRCVSCASL